MDEHALSQPFRWRRTFKWLHLCRAFRIALDIRKLLLVVVGLSLIDSGNYAISRLFPTEDGATAIEANSIPERFVQDFLHWNARPAPLRDVEPQAMPLDIAKKFAEHPADTVWEATSNWWLVMRPFREVIEPAAYLIGDEHTVMGNLQAVFSLLWNLLVWSIFAGAVSRMAAIEFATDDRSGMISSLKFSITRFPAYGVALALPLLVFAAIWGVGFLGGLASHIPVVGEMLVAVFYPLGLLLAVVMALIVMGMLLGWPLMIAAVSTEDTDGFDAFSRAFSHVYNRPWHYLWNVLVSLFHGSMAIFFVGMFGMLVAYLAQHSIGSGVGESRFDALTANAPKVESSAVENSVSVAPIATSITSMWLGLWMGLMVAYVFTYFWCSSTINFFLLRLSDDGIPLGTVAVEEPEDEGFTAVPTS